MTTNGHVELAETEVRDKLPTGEIGSAAGAYDQIYRAYDDGNVFSVGPATCEDFDTMLRLDGKARTLEQVLTLPLRSAEWSIEPSEGDSGQADFVREALTRPANAGGMTTPLELVIAQMTSAVVNRRAYFEKVFAAHEGRVVYHKIRRSPADSCEIRYDKRNYGFKGYSQRYRSGDDVKEVKIPAEKAFVYIHGQHRDPLYGISDLDTAWSIFESKQKIRFLWYSALENHTIPKAIAQHSTNDEGEQRAFAEKVATLKSGGVVGIGPDQNVTPFESTSGADAVFREAMAYLDGEMAGSVLAAFTELPTDGVGSYALSADQSSLFLQSRQGVLTEMGSALTSWIIADLVKWNFGAGASVPRFVFRPLARESADESLDMLKHLASQPTLPPAFPGEFMDLLIEKAADLLGIDRKKVADALSERAERNAAPGAQLRAGVDAATRLVAQAQVASAA